MLCLALSLLLLAIRSQSHKKKEKKKKKAQGRGNSATSLQWKFTARGGDTKSYPWFSASGSNRVALPV